MTGWVTTFLLVGLVALGLGTGSPGVRADTPPALSSFPVSVSATPSDGPAPLQVAFQASVSTGTPTAYNWTFGDGTYLNGTNTSDAHPSHDYTAAGLFVAGVRVREGTEWGNGSIAVRVASSALVLRVTATPDTGTAPLTVTFQGIVSGGSGTYVTFSWAFGDGGTGTGPSIEYTYLRAGHFYATLDVQDSNSAEARSGVWVNLSAAGDTPSAQVTGLGTVGWAFLGFAAGLVAAIVAFPLRTWVIARRPAPPSEPSQPLRAPPAPAPTPSSPERSATHVSREQTTTPASLPTPGPVEALRLSQRIVIHLAAQGSAGPYDVAPPGVTQAGMSAALGARQNALTNVLRRLIDGGVLEQEVRHVRGQPRRLKTYRLTSRGELLARELRHTPPRGPAE